MDILLTATLNRSLFVNGLNQNIIFLAEMLKDMGHNVSICVNHEVDDCIDPPLGILIMEEQEMKDYSFDFILQTGFPLKDQTITHAKLRNRKVKNIHVHYGNRLMTDIEKCNSSKSVSLSSHMVDECWISPHYAFSIPYLEIYYNTDQVKVIPYIWEPKYMPDVRPYSPEDKKNIGITEPNISFTKNCLLPIFLTERTFRKDPESFNQLQVHCSVQFRDKAMFVSLMKKLSMDLAGKIVFGPRQPMKDVLNNCNVIVSHQLYNGLNYTYLEAFYLGIPVIHNSSYMKDGGYYYNDFKIDEGSEQLHKALLTHDDYLDEYKIKSSKVIERFSPNNPSVRNRYQSILS